MALNTKDLKCPLTFSFNISLYCMLRNEANFHDVERGITTALLGIESWLGAAQYIRAFALVRSRRPQYSQTLTSDIPLGRIPPPVINEMNFLLSAYGCIFLVGVISNGSLGLALCCGPGAKTRSPLLLGLITADLLVCGLSGPVTAALYTVSSWTQTWHQIAFFIQVFNGLLRVG